MSEPVTVPFAQPPVSNATPQLLPLREGVPVHSANAVPTALFYAIKYSWLIIKEIVAQQLRARSGRVYGVPFGLGELPPCRTIFG